MMVFFAILAIILLFGMIGDKKRDNRKNYTYSFIAVIVAIVTLYIIR